MSYSAGSHSCPGCLHWLCDLSGQLCQPGNPSRNGGLQVLQQMYQDKPKAGSSDMHGLAEMVQQEAVNRAAQIRVQINHWPGENRLKYFHAYDMTFNHASHLNKGKGFLGLSYKENFFLPPRTVSRGFELVRCIGP